MTDDLRALAALHAQLCDHRGECNESCAVWDALKSTYALGERAGLERAAEAADAVCNRWTECYRVGQISRRYGYPEVVCSAIRALAADKEPNS